MPGHGGYGDGSVVCFNRTFGNCQTETGSAGFVSDEWSEDIFKLFFGNSAAVVGDLDFKESFFGGGSQVNLLQRAIGVGGRYGIPGVLEQVQDYFPQFYFVTLNIGK